MTTTALPVARLINVQAVLTPAAAQAQNLSTLLLMSAGSVIDSIELYRIYASASAVSADFGGTSPEYLAANAYFSQTPQPRQLMIGRYAGGSRSGGLRGGVLSTLRQNVASTWNPITTGSFNFAKDGAAAIDVTGLNFSAVTDMNGVAAVFQAAMTGCTCTWNPVYQRLEFASSTSGATSAISYFAAAATGSDVSVISQTRSGASGSYTYPGTSGADDPATLVATFDNNYGQFWYAMAFANITTVVPAEQVKFAQAIQGLTNKHILSLTSNDAACLSAVSTTDLPYLIKQLGLSRTFVTYTSQNYSVGCAAVAKLLTVDYAAENSTITLMYKRLTGVIAESLSLPQVTALEAKNCSVFVNYDNGTSIFQQGLMGDGNPADTIAGVDWLAVNIMTALYNVLYTSPTKIPQTDAGMHVLSTAIESICSQAVRNGLCAPGQWNATGFGALSQGDFLAKGFYAFAPRVSDQSLTDRATRKSVAFQTAIKLAGAVHFVFETVLVNQ
jgi:hypothetical protein